MSQYVEGPDAEQVIEHQSQLIDYFYQAGKPRQEWRIGTEYEMVGVSRRSGRAARYSTNRGIERLLFRLADSLGWEPQEEEGHVIALRGETGQYHPRAGGSGRTVGRTVQNHSLHPRRVG